MIKTQKKTMMKRQKLQNLIDSLVRDEIKDESVLKYVPNKGCYLMFLEQRSFTDEGDFLGDNYDSAMQYIKSRKFYSIYS